MLNKLTEHIRRYGMLCPGDRVTCAVSGGADSMALLWALYLLRDSLQITLAAAHFNHGLRGAESDRDEAFVRQFCEGYGIPFCSGHGRVTAGKKGLEAAAREARYAFFQRQPGKIATAHTADDNAETVLLHLVRGTGLKGLGAIAPVNGRLIRPMLTVTRQEVESFLAEYHVPHITDSSNDTDAYLRNRLRHHVMPLLKQENPQLAQNLSAMAMRLREDEAALAQPAENAVERLRQLDPARRGRAIAALLEQFGVREPEAAHIALTEKLVFSTRPSGSIRLPGGICIRRNYGLLEPDQPAELFAPMPLPCPGTLEVGTVRIVCTPCDTPVNTPDCFTVTPRGALLVRPRLPGDTMKAYGGTKAVKKLFIDKKIPAALRPVIPVIADAAGILGVWKLGPDQNRLGPGIQIRFEKMENPVCGP